MGGCAGSQKPKRTIIGERYDAEPADTAGLDPASFPSVSFHWRLSHVKLKRCSHNVGFKIALGDFQEIELAPKSLQNQIARWNVQYINSFKSTLYEMRKKFIVFTLFSAENQHLKQLKINLYMLATGPYHQDFAFPLADAPNTRLSFDLRLSEVVKMRVALKETSLVPSDREYPGDTFAFCLRAILLHRTQESDLSYKFQISLDDKGAEAPKLSDSLKLNKRTSLLRKETISYQIWWNNEKEGGMPQLQTQIPLHDLHGATFNIIFYSFIKGRQEMSSQCFISYNKLASFAHKQISDPNCGIRMQRRQVQMAVKTFNNEKEVGDAFLRFDFDIQTHIKQMQICVRTQEGILESSPVFHDSGGRNTVQLQEIESLNNQIQNFFIQISQKKDKGSKAQLLVEVNRKLIKQHQILISSHKQSKLMFDYSDKKALMRGQLILIDLGVRIEALLREDSEAIAENCWSLLIALMKRGQMTLQFIGFTQQELQEQSTTKESAQLKQKIKVAVEYHRLMVSLLRITLQSLQNYNYEKQKNFAELFCAFAYFAIPKFRDAVVANICRKDDPAIEQWRGTEFNLTEQLVDPKTGPTVYTTLFNWQKQFYAILGRVQAYKTSQLQLAECLKFSGWQQRMRKRGGAFFAFVRYWVSYVESITVRNQNIGWKYFPGYNKILQGFMAQMKNQEIARYSEAMKRALVSLLANQKLINPFVLILLKKTNCYQQMSVIRTFDILHLMFVGLSRNATTISTAFDINLLFRSIKRILQGDSAYPIGKVLLLIYDHYNLLPVQPRIQISIYLMSTVFFKLFLHWSANVRSIFHHLFFIRIYHEASKPIDKLNIKEREIFRNNPEYQKQILDRYNKLIIILENAQEFQHKIRKMPSDFYESNLYKKLRNKIAAKRKQGSTGSTSITSRKRDFANQKEYLQQLMVELAEPKLKKYSSEVFSRILKVAVQSARKREQVIVRQPINNTNKAAETTARKSLKNLQNILQSELVPLKQQQMVYVRISLEEYHKINEMFIKHVEKNRGSVPVVRLELALDENQLRPQGIPEHQEW